MKYLVAAMELFFFATLLAIGAYLIWRLKHG